MDFTALLPNTYSPNAFSSLTIESENIFEAPKKIELLDLFITEFPRLSKEDVVPTHFAFSYFPDFNRNDLLKNQDIIQLLSKDLFNHTIPLNDFQQDILNKSYAKALKSSPTRKNRL